MDINGGTGKASAHIWWINGTFHTPSAIIKDGVMLVDEQGKIEQVGSAELADSGLRSSTSVDVVDLQGRTVIPGLIDVHVHGGNGFHMLDATYESLEGISRYHGKHGTTAFLATTTTASYEELTQGLDCAAQYVGKDLGGAQLAGIHMEGPFLNPVRCGAQDQTHIRPPDLQELKQLLAASRHNIRLVTLAPELENGYEAVTLLSQQGVMVSLGHSNATYPEVEEAIRCGARHTTHHFNGMSPFNHRDPGLAGAGMIKSELTVELIADGIHVHPDVIKLLLEIKGPWNVCMITDAVTCAGLPDGIYGRKRMENGIIYLKDEGNLAGSSLTMIDALRNVLKFTGMSLQQVLPSFTSVPARQAGLTNRKGSLERGKDADFVILDDDMQLHATVVMGHQVYNSEFSQP